MPTKGAPAILQNTPVAAGLYLIPTLLPSARTNGHVVEVVPRSRVTSMQCCSVHRQCKQLCPSIAHFLRHVKGRWHDTQILLGKLAFSVPRGIEAQLQRASEEQMQRAEYFKNSLRDRWRVLRR